MQTNETGLEEAVRAATAEYPGPGRGAGKSGKTAQGIAQGALLIASLTAVSRMLGLARTLVFSHSVGADCLGTAYVTANQVPNLIYELALGGALTSAIVPVLARSAEQAGTHPQHKAHVAQITSAMLTWAVIILVPLTAVVAVAARPVAALLIPVNANAGCNRADMLNITSNMIIVFAPQIVLYGFSVVMFGLLQAYRRFTGPTLAPVIANFVMIGSYIAFAALDKGASLGSTPLAAELALSLGATLNIGTLVVVALPPAWRLHLRLRATLRFPRGVLRRAGGLVVVGVLEFLAGDVANVVSLALINGHGDAGALVVLNYSNMVFNAVCAVLVMSIITSAFPVLAASDGEAFDRTCAGSTRAVVLMSGLGTAMIAAVCVPAAHVLAKQPAQVPELVQAFALTAPSVLGMALLTNISRVMFALGRLKVAAAGLIAAPLLQIAVGVPLIEVAPARLVVAAAALTGTVSLLAAACPMVIATRRIRGKQAVLGVGRATFAGLAAGVAGATAGVLASMAVPAGGKMLEALSGVLAVTAAFAAFGVVAFLLDKSDLRTVTARVRRFGGFGRSGL
jgi:putative peptidoglycan lipid II flippase